VDLCFNMVLKRGNYQEVPRFLRECAAMGIKVSLSTYNCWRTNNRIHMIEKDELQVLQGVIEELKDLKKTQGNLTSSLFYLERVTEFFETCAIDGCTAGLNWVQLTPDGMIKRCSDHPVAVHFSEWHEKMFQPTACRRCWYSCRGAAQEPWSLKRFIEMSRDALNV
jgi:hypothetical protein